MALKLNEGSEFKPAPPGLHNAICCWVVDLGLQSGIYGMKPKLLLGFELPDCLMETGKPYFISRQYGATLHKQGNLRPLLAAWRGRDFTADELGCFDVGKLLGKPLKLLIQHNTGADGRTHADITAAIKPEPGQLTAVQNPLVLFDTDAPDSAAKALLPEWVQRLIDAAVPPEKPAPAVAPAAPFDDDLTF